MTSLIGQTAAVKRDRAGREYEFLSCDQIESICRCTDFNHRQVELAALKNGIVPERYQQNLGVFGIEGQIRLLESKVAVAGAGGLGGAVTELLARSGVGSLVVVDGDVFADSNLNRQILGSVQSLGRPKAEVARERIGLINPAVRIRAEPAVITSDNCGRFIAGCDVVIDALDNVPTRLLLADQAKSMGIPLVHGAVAGFLGQIMTIFPTDEGLSGLYGRHPDRSPEGLEKKLGIPGVSPFVVAALQVSEAIKIILRQPPAARNRLFVIDIKKLMTDTIDFR